MEPVITIGVVDTDPFEQERIRFTFSVVRFMAEDQCSLVSGFVTVVRTRTAPWTEATTWAALMASNEIFLLVKIYYK